MDSTFSTSARYAVNGYVDNGAAAMWRGLWCKADGQVQDAEVRITGRVADTGGRGSPEEDASPDDDQAGEIAAFLARVYTNQQC